MKQEYSLRNLHIAGFARDAGCAKVEVPLADMPRLSMEAAQPETGAAASLVGCEVIGSMKIDAAGQLEPWLNLKGGVDMPLVCQRCLGTVRVYVEFDRDFRFVPSEALAEVEDEESEEDVLVLSKSFDVLQLVEDELIMAMPPAPMHPTCPNPVTLRVADAGFDAEVSTKPRPFDALKQFSSRK